MENSLPSANSASTRSETNPCRQTKNRNSLERKRPELSVVEHAGSLLATRYSVPCRRTRPSPRMWRRRSQQPTPAKFSEPREETWTSYYTRNTAPTEFYQQKIGAFVLSCATAFRDKRANLEMPPITLSGLWHLADIFVIIQNYLLLLDDLVGVEALRSVFRRASDGNTWIH